MFYQIENLHFNENEVVFSEVNLLELAEQFGTPLYVYNASTIKNRYKTIKNALNSVKQDNMICYAVKANSNLAILKILADLGAGFDIVSYGELQRVLEVGVSADRVVFAGVGKTDFEIESGLKAGVFAFNVESLPELRRINTIAQSLGLRGNIQLRINPNVDAKTHKYITTGVENSKFGISLKDIDEALNLCKSSEVLNFKGFHMHLGSQIESSLPFRLGIDVIKQLIIKAQKIGLVCETIDIGGGFSVGYKSNQDFNFENLVQELTSTLKDTNIKLIVEPGRFLTAEAGILLTKVLYRKENFVITDASMTELIRPSLYQAYHPICNITQKIPPKLSEQSLDSEIDGKFLDFVGPVCESGDFLGTKRDILVDQSDIIAVLYAGAYGYSMSSNYNSRPKPAEILIEQKKIKIINGRENIKDLVKKEKSFLDF